MRVPTTSTLTFFLRVSSPCCCVVVSARSDACSIYCHIYVARKQKMLKDAVENV